MKVKNQILTFSSNLKENQIQPLLFHEMFAISKRFRIFQ